MSRYDKELYEWYKEHGICPHCGTHTAAPGKVRCEVCLAKNAARTHKRMDPETAKRNRQRRQAEGKCVWCGKPRAKDSKCYCIDCRIKNRRRLAEKRGGIDRSERPAYGMCYRCGAPIEGGKLCEDCTEQSMRNLPKPSQDSAWYRYHKEQNRAVFANGGMG